MDRSGRLDAVALTGLLPGHTSLTRADQSSTVPLLVKAFPLAIGPVDGDGHVSIMIHQIPEGAKGPIAPAIDVGGNLNPSFVEKSDCLWLFAASWKATQDVLHDLHNANALRPWQLDLVFEDGEERPVSDLLSIHPAFVETEAYSQLITKHGLVVGTIVESQLLSRGNIQTLADLARPGPQDRAGGQGESL